MAKCFKVARIVDDKRVSCVVKGRAQVKYVKDQKAEPPPFLADANHGLFVFNQWYFVTRFIEFCVDPYCDYAVFECEYEQEIPLPVSADFLKLSYGVITPAAWSSGFSCGTKTVDWLIPRKEIAIAHKTDDPFKLHKIEMLDELR